MRIRYLDIQLNAQRREIGGELTKAQATLGLATMTLFAVLYGRLLYAPCDDAYIFYVYVRNLMAGNGLTYNGTCVWGFSSLLWVGLLSLTGLFRIPVHLGGEILSGFSGCFALWATYRLGRRLSLSRLYALGPPLLLAATGDFAFYSSVGLEQTLFAGLAAFAASLIVVERRVSPRHILAIAVTMLAMILTRPEGALVCSLLLLLWAMHLRSFRAPFVCGTLLVCLIAPFLVGMRMYYGDWLPNTYYVKSNAGLANLSQGVRYMRSSLLRYGVLGLIGTASVAYRVLTGRIRESARVLPMLMLTAIWIVYVMFQGGDNMVGGRVLIPILPPAYVAVVVLAPSLPKKVFAGLTLAIGAGMTAAYAMDQPVADHAKAWRRTFVVRRNAGIYLRDHFAPGTCVALNPAGVIPYYSGLRTIDMLGLNDRYIAQRGKRDRRLRFGHQAGDGRYVLSCVPDVILLGSGASPTPGYTVSDQEIWASREFWNDYVRADWEGIGTAYVRTRPHEGSVEHEDQATNPEQPCAMEAALTP